MSYSHRWVVLLGALVTINFFFFSWTTVALLLQQKWIVGSFFAFIASYLFFKCLSFIGRYRRVTAYLETAKNFLAKLQQGTGTLEHAVIIESYIRRGDVRIRDLGITRAELRQLRRAAPRGFTFPDFPDFD